MPELPVLFSRIAEQEFLDAEVYYEVQQPGLGGRFRKQVIASVQRLRNYPRAWERVQQGEIRKCPVHRFPYHLFYALEADHILVLAVAHAHRKPMYWSDRIDE